MNIAEAIHQLPAGSIISQSTAFGETTLEVSKGTLIPTLLFLKPSFEVLMDLTGVDYLLPIKRTKLVYLLHNPSTFERLRLVLFAERDESIPSVTSLWDGANWYERELYDLFGVSFEGHPDLSRILMPDDWKGHPLRRDYALTEEVVEFKHCAMPKIPSQVIPYAKN